MDNNKEKKGFFKKLDDIDTKLFGKHKKLANIIICIAIIFLAVIIIFFSRSGINNNNELKDDGVITVTVADGEYDSSTGMYIISGKIDTKDGVTTITTKDGRQYVIKNNYLYLKDDKGNEKIITKDLLLVKLYDEKGTEYTVSKKGEVTVKKEESKEKIILEHIGEGYETTDFKMTVDGYDAEILSVTIENEKIMVKGRLDSKEYDEEYKCSKDEYTLALSKKEEKEKALAQAQAEAQAQQQEEAGQGSYTEPQNQGGSVQPVVIETGLYRNTDVHWTVNNNNLYENVPCPSDKYARLDEIAVAYAKGELDPHDYIDEIKAIGKSLGYANCNYGYDQSYFNDVSQTLAEYGNLERYNVPYCEANNVYNQIFWYYNSETDRALQSNFAVYVW